MNRSRNRVIFVITCISFFSFGIYSAGLGPVILELADRIGSTPAAIGIIFTAIYTGSLLTQITSGWLTTKFGRMTIMTISILLIALGLFGLVNVKSLGLLVSFCFVIGLGQGGLDMVSNLIVSQAYPEKSVAFLNILHLVYGVGSTLGPILVSLFIKYFNRGLLVEWVAGVMFFALGLVFLFIHREEKVVSSETVKVELVEDKQTPVFTNVLVWLLGAMLFIVVGTQFSVGSWASIFLTNTTGLSPEKASMSASLYWMFISIGRVLAIFLSNKLTQMKMLFVNIAGSIVGSILFLITTGAYLPSLISLIFIGLSFGGFYPLLLSFMPKFFGKNVDKAGSIIITSGTVGGMILPSLAGNILNSISPAAFAWAILFFISSLAVLSLILNRKTSQKEQLPNAA
ncbi:MFS transporter [Chloroflexota bacterium]|nr:MFS transporter [Chloroflexota bacterium]